MGDRPAWLAAVVAQLGEPSMAVPEEIRLGDQHRRCWVWFPDKVNHNVAIDRAGGRYEVHAGGRGGSVQLVRVGEPTDAQMRSVCALVGLLPGQEGDPADDPPDQP